MGDITRLLHSANAGDANASRELFALMCGDLKRLAHGNLRRHGGRDELNTTMLVHESFVKLAARGGLAPADRPAFFAYVGKVMRRNACELLERAVAIRERHDASISPWLADARLALAPASTISASALHERSCSAPGRSARRMRNSAPISASPRANVGHAELPSGRPRGPLVGAGRSRLSGRTVPWNARRSRARGRRPQGRARRTSNRAIARRPAFRSTAAAASGCRYCSTIHPIPKSGSVPRGRA